MLVREAMTPAPVTITEDRTARDADAAMRRGRFRHLPVVDGGEVVGIVAHGDVEIPAGTPAGTAEALLDRPVGEVMTPDPVTVDAAEPVEVAAGLLLEHRIGGLPVLDAGGLAGIVTESDVFRAFVRLTGVLEPSTRVAAVLDDRPGPLADLVRVVAGLGVNVIALVLEPGPRPGTRTAVARLATIQPGPVVAALARAGIEVLLPEPPAPRRPAPSRRERAERAVERAQELAQEFAQDAREALEERRARRAPDGGDEGR